jgi:hypothetical protein
MGKIQPMGSSVRFPFLISDIPILRVILLNGKTDFEARDPARRVNRMFRLRIDERHQQIGN